MEKLSMCRICLGKDMPLNCIETHLQKMYESLVLMPFKAEDTTPILVCYICRARLQNCYELRKCCLRSEEMFIELSYDELLKVTQHEHYKNRLTQVYNIVKLSMGDVVQMKADNIDVDTRMLDDVKLEQIDTEDIIEDALEENSIYDNSEAADSDDDPLIVVNKEQSRDSTSEVSPMYSEQAVQTSRDLKQHQLVQDKFKEVNKVTAADKTAATSTNESTFTLNDNNKERCTSVPYTIPITFDTSQPSSQVGNEDLSHEDTADVLTVDKPYACDICEKRFSRASALTRHFRTHTGEKPYRCDICNKQFADNSHLTKHKFTHTDKKPYRCDVCNKQFLEKGNLDKHMFTHTGEKPYRCNLCRKQFSQKGSLVKHKLTHTGEKPYRCDVCNKQYGNMSNLSRHMRTHTGEKPFHCDICNKQFSAKACLASHVLTHTGEKPHRCEICNKQFSQKGSLGKHRRTCMKRFSPMFDLNVHKRTQTHY